MKLAKWQKDYLKELKDAPNHILLGKYVEDRIPDDYDGRFSAKGEWRKQVSAKEFYARLVITDWITQGQLNESGAESW